MTASVWRCWEWVRGETPGLFQKDVRLFRAQRHTVTHIDCLGQDRDGIYIRMMGWMSGVGPFLSCIGVTEPS